jgi:aromatic-L-amino-acid/L-tryptophan decarboxylase
MSKPDPAKRTTIIALHGAGMHAGIWGGITPHLLDYHLQAVSLPGHDPKKPGDALPTVEAMSAWLSGELSARQGTDAEAKIILMGHSMGALVALATAAHPAVSGVILLGAAATMPVNDVLLQAAVNDPASAAEMILKWGVYHEHPQKEAVTTVVRAIMAATQPQAIGADLKACNDYTGGAAAAQALQKPALVIAGESDKMARADQVQALADMIEGVHHALLPACGHMMMLEHPIETAAEIKAFLSATVDA